VNEDMECCRDCGHFRFLHILESEDIGLYRSNQGCDPQNDHGCDCSEYVPEDNLDYIEWLAEKKGLLK
jgi:hypothetical protein